MSGPALRAGATLWLVVCVFAAPSAAGPTIDGLRVVQADDRLLVSFDVDGAFTERALERLAAGLPLVFRHTVEVQSKRAVPLWFPRVVARASVVNRADYDSLTRRYRLTRRVSVERRGEGADSTGGESAESTESLDRVRAFMEQVRELPVLDLLGVTRVDELRVRVESSVGRRYSLLFIPTTVRATAVVPVGP